MSATRARAPAPPPLPACRLRVLRRDRPLRRAFTISRGSRTRVHTIVVELADAAGHLGRGEAVPYPRHGETPERALADLRRARPAIEAGGLSVHDLPRMLSTLAARTALDCAMWNLAARRAGRPVWALAGLPRPRPRRTACTISLATPDNMAAEARERAAYPLLKMKLGGTGGAEAEIARLRAVRAARPDAELIVDANEGWRATDLPRLLQACAAASVALVEQPLPAGADAILADIPRPVVVCADESVRGQADLSALAARYDAINVKLDKAGGFTPALALARGAREHDMRIMIGCMLAGSLAMAPAFLLAPLADWIDLDGPLLLAEDDEPGIVYDGALMHPPPPTLWG